MGTEVVAAVKPLDRIHDVAPAQPGILEHGKLMTLFIGHHRVHRVVVFLQVGIELGARVRMGHGDLNRFRIKLHGKLNRPLDRLGSFTGQPDLKVAVHDDPQLLAMFHELARLFNRRAFFDVLEHLRVARLKPDD